MKRANAVCAAASGLLVCGLMLLLSCEILGRKMGHPIPGATEFAGFALVGIIFLGLARCEEVRGHVRVEFLITRFPHKLRYAAELFVHFIGFCLYALMTWQTAIDAASSWKTFETVPGLMTLPVYPAKTMVPLGCGMISIQIVVNAIGWIRNHPNPDTSMKADG